MTLNIFSNLNDFMVLLFYGSTTYLIATVRGIQGARMRIAWTGVQLEWQDWSLQPSLIGNVMDPCSLLPTDQGLIGVFVSTNEKLWTTEHDIVFWRRKEIRTCFIVIGFQKGALLQEIFQIVKGFITLSTGNCLSDMGLGTVVKVQNVQMCYLWYT